MKKGMSIFFVIFMLFVLAACGEDARVYAYDGEFLAYELSVSRDAPQVTYVSVTIENDQIVSYNIDTRQGSRTGEGTEASPYVWAWNTQTKKELGDAYGMANNSSIDKEWYEQAAAIEAFWLENGTEAITVDGDGHIDNVAGATMSDSYSGLAQQAIQHAIDGTFVAILASGTDLYSAEMTLHKDGIETLLLDVKQSTRSATTGSFAWNEKSKQELGDDYGMKDVGAKYAFTNGEWVASSTEKASLEWHEQVGLIAQYIIANGYHNNLQALNSRGGTIDGTTLIDALSGATIRTGTYYDLLDVLFQTPGTQL